MPRFEVGIREAKTVRMMSREWSRAELEQSAAWLKRMNAKGNDIYIRPAGEHGLVLVDDLKPEALKAMQDRGYTPAATVETSPGNYQAWVKLSDKPLSAEVRRIAAQSLAKAFGGDMNSADSRHYGRLAGFTNQKPQHTRDGRQAARHRANKRPRSLRQHDRYDIGGRAQHQPDDGRGRYGLGVSAIPC